MNLHSPDHSFEIAIVIPCFKEEDPVNVLNSLAACTCSQPDAIGIWMVFNYPEGATQDVIDITLSGYRAICNLSIEGLNVFSILFDNMPLKKAGVGLARKTGMDEAVKFLHPDGLLVNLDADCEVSDNYLQALLEFKREKKQFQGASIHFEHPFPTQPELREAIILYELHLRYYIQAQRWLKLPYAFHTIGSAMAVRANVYIRSGGMNTRKAGEDFYFMQKIIQAGSFTEINNAAVYPSARISDRVPFGTGRAVMETLESGRYKYTYPLECFYLLVPFLEAVATAISDDKPVKVMDIQKPIPLLETFLRANNFYVKWEEIWENTRQKNTRLRRFYQWWDAFLLMKWCNFYKENKGASPIQEASSALLREYNITSCEAPYAEHLLNKYRKMQREVFYKIN